MRRPPAPTRSTTAPGAAATRARGSFPGPLAFEHRGTAPGTSNGRSGRGRGAALPPAARRRWGEMRQGAGARRAGGGRRVLLRPQRRRRLPPHHRSQVRGVEGVELQLPQRRQHRARVVGALPLGEGRRALSHRGGAAAGAAGPGGVRSPRCSGNKVGQVKGSRRRCPCCPAAPAASGSSVCPRQREVWHVREERCEQRCAVGEVRVKVHEARGGRRARVPGAGQTLFRW